MATIQDFTPKLEGREIKADGGGLRGGQVSRFDFGDPDFFEDSGKVSGELLNFLVGFAQGEVDDGEFGLGFERYRSAGTHLFSAGGGIGHDGAIFGVRHQALRTQDLGVLGQFAHIGGSSQKNVEVKLIVVEGGDSLVGEDLDFKGFTGREGNFDFAAEAGFEGIGVEIDALVRAGGSDKQFEGRLGGVGEVAIDLFDEYLVAG